MSAGDVTLHMAETHRVIAYGEWVAFCRCGWTGSYLPTQEESRRDGDKHLAEANADPKEDEMHECSHCHYRFEDAESLTRHLEEGRGCPDAP